MVQVHKSLPVNDDGTVNLETWLQHSTLNTPLVREAAILSRLASEDCATPYGQSCFTQSLEIAETVAELKLGEEALAAALAYSAAEYADLSIDDIREQLGPKVAELVQGAQQLHDVSSLELGFTRSHKNIDSIRRMLLAMVRDVRAVIIKLAERISIMRAIHHLSDAAKLKIANETMNIYAPLASRLGISDIKWKLEDLSFSILCSDTYKEIVSKLQERRVDRDARVQMILSSIQQFLSEANIDGQVQGRAKHIYSIWRKMQRKKVGLQEIYDTIAVRVLVPTEKDCYTILSKAHEKWKPIPEEFDDYINAPKPNGYQSIHTAVMDTNGKHFEIQLRTYKMHEESEMGVASHWMYKEGGKSTGYEEKIKCLRQLLEWQKEVTTDEALPQELERNLFEDRIYVFTPNGEILDLPAGATPLDFAYSIHTEVGHRCRGAKVAGKIKPLNSALSMGDTITILTGKESKPSRDWLIPQRGYLKTTRARAKVLHWFKKQDADQHLEQGRQILEREFKRLNISETNLDKLANQVNHKTADSMLIALGAGDLRLAQILNLVQQNVAAQAKEEADYSVTSTKTPRQTDPNDVMIYGVGDLLTHVAKCCKPIPGDPIVGYITQGKGVSIHSQNCKNILNTDESHQNRLIEVDWVEKTRSSYPVDVEINAYDRPGLVSDIAQILANDKISILNLLTTTNKKNQSAQVNLTIEMSDLNKLGKVLDTFNNLPNVMSVVRKKPNE